MPTNQTYWCTNCREYKDEPSHCAENYNLGNRNVNTVIACGIRPEVSRHFFSSATNNWSEEAHYCRVCCFNQFSNLNNKYCSSHSYLESNFVSYSYSYSGSSASTC